jgi:Cu+-exporting ATPase
MSNIKNISVPIKGMHCRSCELLIEDKLKEIPKIKSAQLNYQTGEAKIFYHGETPDIKLISEAIKEAGYEVGRDEDLPFVSRDKKEYFSLGIAALVLMALFFPLALGIYFESGVIIKLY